MHGTDRSTVKCLECEEEPNTDDSFISLSLPIHRPTASGFGLEMIQNITEKAMGFFGYGVQNGNTLYDCFHNLLESEQLGANGQWFCQNCQKLADAIRKLDLYQLPQVLILQLKRFTYDLTNDTKITTKNHFQEVLDLEKFIKKNDTNKSSIYDLVAVLAHTGTLVSGHYMTFARRSSNCCWYHFNDRHVRQASLNEALASDAYVLVYERRHLHSSS
jgi:ubiquitin C-terminal hydrolase